MDKLFVPYKLALLAKEKGFDEPCLAMFNLEKNLRMIKNKTGYPNGSKNSECEPNILAPLYQQLVDWFREKHKLYIHDNRYYGGFQIVSPNFPGELHYGSLNGALTDAFNYIKI